MKTSKQLHEERRSIEEKQRDLARRLTDEGRGFTSDEREQFDRMEADCRSVNDQMEALKVLKAEVAEAAQGERSTDNEQPQRAAAPKYDEVFGKWLVNGQRSLNAQDRDVARQKRAQSTGVTTAGGFISPEHWDGSLIVKMKQYGGMMQAATTVRTADGNPVYHPITDDTGNVGEIVGENIATTEQDLAFAQTQIGAYKYSSKRVLVSLELAQDENYGLEGILTDAFARRIGVLANTHFTTGDGSGKPTGFLTNAGLNYTGATTGVSRTDLVRLKHTVDPSYRVPGAAFMMNDATLAEIKLLSFGSGDDRPLWQPAMSADAPATIDGNRYFINQQMANLGASAEAIAFGDFSKYLIRIAKDFEIFRFGEKYMDQGSVGYLAFARMDGILLDTNAIAKMTNAAS